MTVTPARILPRHDLSVTEIDRLEDRLYEHNRRATGRDDGKGLSFVVVDEHDIQIGVIAGYSWAGMTEIKQLWVDEGHRGHGLGRKLLEAAIAEAIVRGCQSVWALSYSFQAPGLYEKCGFERVAELADWPPGHAHIVLRRRLSETTQTLSTGERRPPPRASSRPIPDGPSRCSIAQSRPKPRGGPIAWSSQRSSSTIPRNASAVALSC